MFTLKMSKQIFSFKLNELRHLSNMTRVQYNPVLPYTTELG
jgi:hypothetical protein